MALSEIQMEPDEIDLMYDLIDKLPDDGLMVEWGSGGSTERWLKRMKGTNKRLISIEHNKQWHTKVTASVNELDEQGELSKHQFTYIYKPNLYPFRYSHGYASITEEHFYGLQDYISADDAIWDADIFFIDGVARNACAVSVLVHSRKPTPAIFIHDYVGREDWYAWAVSLYSRHEVVASKLIRLHCI